ncbi:MAG: alpha/beta fold hydrolase [Leptolyngbyaceae cyanobacterium bins.349]|nr:alpha/beta fold hydrolase [Leptolyngbyaceae cyanobacterium bins.349]
MLPSPWLKCLAPNSQASLRLFCFPYAGGSAATFGCCSEFLPAWIEMWAIQLPGRSDRFKEAPIYQLSSLVQLLFPHLQPHLDRPFAFWGHSMGALLSFEVARTLRTERHISPCHLFVSGRRAPHLPDRLPHLHTLADQEFLAELHRFNGTPSKVLNHPELMQLLLPCLRADFSICGTYVYVDQAPLECWIAAFAGTQDSSEPPELLEGWRLQTRSQFSLQVLPGDHFFPFTSPELLRTIVTMLA